MMVGNSLSNIKDRLSSTIFVKLSLHPNYVLVDVQTGHDQDWEFFPQFQSELYDK
jgi:hypothetical protein